MQEIILDTPIPRGETKIEKIAILEPPGTGWLRGIKLLDLIQADTDALCVVLPRITDPALTEADIRGKLSPADLLRLANEVSRFFTPKPERAADAESLPA